jgi:hypothetical protein
VKDNFLLPFSFIIFHVFFQNFKKKLYESQSLQKNTFTCFLISKKIYMKVVFCKDNFHINFFEKACESCLL